MASETVKETCAAINRIFKDFERRMLIKLGIMLTITLSMMTYIACTSVHHNLPEKNLFFSDNYCQMTPQNVSDQIET